MDDIVDVMILYDFLILAFLGNVEYVEFAGGLFLRLLQVGGEDVFCTTSILISSELVLLLVESWKQSSTDLSTCTSDQDALSLFKGYVKKSTAREAKDLIPSLVNIDIMFIKIDGSFIPQSYLSIHVYTVV